MFLMFTFHGLSFCLPFSGGYRGGARGPCPPPLEAHVPTLPLQKSVESKAGKRDFKNT